MIGLLMIMAAATAQPSYAERRANFEASVQGNIGHDINDLIRRIGAPARQYQMPNGNTLYTFDKSMQNVMTCIVNFEADAKGKILSASYDGCVA